MCIAAFLGKRNGVGLLWGKDEGEREEREMPKVLCMWVGMCFCLERVRNEMRRGGREVGSPSSFLVISKNP